MSRSLFGTPVSQVFGGSVSGARRGGRRSRVRSHLGIESLEERRLMADNIIPSAVITATPQGADFKYDITLTNSSQSNAPIGTFWYAWVPGKDFLATSPISETAPTGWIDSITHTPGNPPDGFAIQFIAGNNGTTNPVEPGSSMAFSFVSADTPAMVFGNSQFYNNPPVGTSFVYSGMPFSDQGFQFVVAAAAPTVTAPEPDHWPGRRWHFGDDHRHQLHWRHGRRLRHRRGHRRHSGQ